MISAITVHTKLPKGREGGSEIVLAKQGASITVGRETQDRFSLKIVNDPAEKEAAILKLSMIEITQLSESINLLIIAPHG